MVDFSKHLRPVKTLHLDYETRSRVNLKDWGAHRYAEDISTEILLCAASWDDQEEVFLWVNPKYRTDGMLGLDNDKVIQMISEADLVYAHNAPFEAAITEMCADAAFQGFKIALHQWRCTMAMARTAGLPPSLEMVGEALGLSDQKDRRGKSLIKLFCEPQKDGEFVDPRDKVDEWIEFGGYCKQDVRTEKGVHRALKPFELKGEVLETYLFDLRMNQRGIPVNVAALKRAQAIIEEVQRVSSEEFVKLTGLNPTQREKVREAVGLPNMQAETVEGAIKELEVLGHSEKARDLRILKLYQNLSYAAVAKVETMLGCVCRDGRVRGCHTFYGTGPGRWSARLIQPQNFKKTPKWMRPIMHDVTKRILDGWGAQELSQVYGEPLELISGIVRHFIGSEKELLDGDFSGIQARVILWLAGEVELLEMMNRGEDMYKKTAAPIYEIPQIQVDSDQREVGKRVFLGCQFQMGADTFQRTCLEQYQLSIPIEVCKKGVKVYREMCPKVVEFWSVLQADALSAVTTPGQPFGRFLVQAVAGIPFLLMRLPSGRFIAYPHPQTAPETYTYKTKDGETRTGKRIGITYWGQLPLSTQWGRIKLYGGKLAENLTMGVEADIASHGLRAAEKRGFLIFMTVHDQGLAEMPALTEGWGRDKAMEHFAEAMGSSPDWADGLPIKIDPKITPYFSK